MSEEIPSPVGRNLKRHRDFAGLSQEKAARRLDVSTRTLQRWEDGQTPLSWKTLAPVARLYGCNVADFFAPLGDDLEPNGDPQVAA